MSVVRDWIGRAWRFLTTAQNPETELAQMRTVSRFMDSAVRVPWTNYRIGADSVVGLLPVGGDVLAACVSLYILYRAALLGLPVRTLGRMTLNIAIDTVLGSVPIVGDLFDVFWKANERNVALVERHLDVS